MNLDITTIIGLGLLVVGFLWSQQATKTPQATPAPQALPTTEPPASTQTARQDAVDAVDLLFKYFEQQGQAEASEPLQKLISLLFTPKVKE